MDKDAERKRLLRLLHSMAAAVFLLLMSSCAGNINFRYDDGKDLPESELAIVETRWGEADVYFITLEEGSEVVYNDFIHGDATVFFLIPGTYIIDYKYWPYNMRIAYQTSRVELKAGHRYRVKRETRYIFGRGTKLWIEDKNSGEVIGGQRW